MSIFSQEHYDIIAAFEKTYRNEARMDKEDKEMWSKGYIYQHAELNRLFIAFRHGVSFGRSYY